MWRIIKQLVTGKDCELRERMFRSIVLVGGAATIVAITEIAIVMEITNALLPMLLLLLLAMAAILYATFKYQKYDIAATLLGLLIIVLIMPIMFCMSSAIDSGADIWLALGILYIFIMFSGKKLAFFLVLSVISYAVTYGIAYFYPELVSAMPTKGSLYIDSFFSVFSVGLVGGIILKAHMRVFEAEHKLNILQKEQLEKSKDAQNAFFANMSHEIRSPINTIIGLNEMILRENTSDEIKEYAYDIQIASKMLLNQVNDILDLSQMELDKMRLIPTQYKTENLFGDLVEMIKVQTEKKKLALYLNIDKNLPSVLCGDEKRLKQILLNILDNAVKYTNEGSVTLSAEGDERHNGEVTLKIKVADTGIGIKKEDLGHIYDSFNRLDEKKNARIMGTGLGLAITKQLVDLMGGEIMVDSIYTKGTIFTIVVKQQIVDEAPIGEINLAARIQQAGEAYRQSFEAPEARILIVDDNAMNAKVAQKLLAETQVQVDVARSGTECLEMTNKKYYHVILMDSMMPDMSGTETLDALRKQVNGLCRESAVIAFTGNTTSSARLLYQEQGYDGFLDKPIDGKRLEAEILRLLPAEIVEYRQEEVVQNEAVSQIQKISRKKRKKICITTDCTCDLPPELLDKYDIKLMYLYIKTPQGRFADTREIDSDSLEQYISEAVADSVTVGEFEEFFAEALTEAERVIHISLASRAGRSHGTAVAAARGFDHVYVLDSEQISCGQGMVVLHAAKLASEGKTVREICESVDKIKKNIHTRIIIPNADLFYKNGRISAVTAKLCRIFQLHPCISMKQKKAVLVGMFGGNFESACKQGIRWHLRKKRKIDKKAVFITHVCCSVKQQEWVKNEIWKTVPFKRIIIQKGSFTNACNVGMGAIAFSYYKY